MQFRLPVGGVMDRTHLDTHRPLPIPVGRPELLASIVKEPYGCLHEIFEAQVDLRPEAPALISDTETLSYLELDRRANQLARCLQFHGIGPKKLVALYFDRSNLPLISILACLKAGAAYVPIDPVYPAERIRHILEESELSLVLTEQALSEKAGSLFSTEHIVVDDPRNGVDHFSHWRLTLSKTGVKASDLCYVIYTSGTTGRPKGVMTEHRNAYQFVQAFNEICQATASDRIYQGFSLGFDGSVEEMWMAFSNGAPLVVPTKDTPRFGNELAGFLTKYGVTYFSTVPTLVSTISEDIPSLRYLVVSGEKCPPELVSRWAKSGRRILNVYGPTEATVNTTSVDCVAGQPVTIGRPIRGYETYILNEAMEPVPRGEKGELYVGGPGLCRGYLKRPDLTDEKFLTRTLNGKSTRIYRTGDLVRWADNGELEFFGRIDSQVKIRGFRVELSEIESVLLEHPLIRAAAVKLLDNNGLQELAAYVTLKDPQATLVRIEVLELLQSRMPEYMIPGFLEVLDAFPMLTSGKTDRAKLPRPLSPLLRASGDIVEPVGEKETAISEVWKKIFSLPKVSVEDDFFLDLGGHSLVAAQMVTLLRKEIHAEVTVRDAYRFPTIRKLAEHLNSLTAPEAEENVIREPRITSRMVFESLSRWSRGITAMSQAVSLYFLVGLVLVPLLGVFLLGANYYYGVISLTKAVVLALAIFWGTWPAMLALAIASKWILIGKYKETKIPLWGFAYFRWWLAARLQAFSGASAFVGTPLMPLYFRAMGAKVGRNVTLDTAACFTWDLIAIGDNTSIGADSSLSGFRVEDGMIVTGSVSIGKNCFIGIHSALGLNVRMEDNSRLDDQSLLPDGATLQTGKSYRGSPAALAEVPIPTGTETIKPRPILFSLLHLIGSYAVATALLIPALGFLGALLAAYYYGGWNGEALALMASVPVMVLVYCFFIAGLKRVLLETIQPGTYSVYSILYLRKWLSDGLMKLSRRLLLPLFTTMYFPSWLRLLGARIGRRAEISTVWYFAPDLMDIGEESFFADGSIIGGKRFFGNRFEVGVNHIGRRSFIGNSAILPMGVSVGDRCLLGVLSAPPHNSEKTVPDGSEWLGSPPFALPNRPKVGNFTDEVTFNPTRKLYFQRAIIDGLRILIPGYLGLGAMVLGVTAMYECYVRAGLVATFLALPLIGFALGFLAILAVVGIKKAVMGTFEPVIQPLWSMYIWLNEMVNGIYESVMAPALVPFLGTPFLAPFLRMIGLKVGKHTYIESTLFSEFDLVSIGDYAALNAGSIIQTHLFEDRVMKSAALKVGDECTVGNMAVVLYNTEMQRGSSLGPLSLLMKGEVLAPMSRWHGIPTVQVR